MKLTFMDYLLGRGCCSSMVSLSPRPYNSSVKCVLLLSLYEQRTQKRSLPGITGHLQVQISLLGKIMKEQSWKEKAMKAFPGHLVFAKSVVLLDPYNNNWQGRVLQMSRLRLGECKCCPVGQDRCPGYDLHPGHFCLICLNFLNFADNVIPHDTDEKAKTPESQNNLLEIAVPFVRSEGWA